MDFKVVGRLCTWMISLTVIASAYARTAKSQVRLGELLISGESVVETREIEHRLPPNAGYHFVRITGTISNAGKHAICTQISAVLESTFNLQSYASVYLNGRYNHSIHEMLPGEQESTDFTFNVKDGVQPLTLIVRQGKWAGL